MLRIRKKKTIICGLVSIIAVVAVLVPAISAIGKSLFVSALDTIIYKKGGIDLVVTIDETSDNFDLDSVQIDGHSYASYCINEPTKNEIVIRASCLDFLNANSHYTLAIITRHSESSNTHSFDYDLSVTTASQVEVGTIGSQFSKDYSRGLMYRGTSVTVNSSTDSSRPFVLEGFSSTINNCPWEETCACATNKWKNNSKITKVTRGAVYNNEYLDVIEYTWKDNFMNYKEGIAYDGITAVYGKNTENGTTIANARADNDESSSPIREELENHQALAYTHREFHFYKTGTNFSEEVSFKGVIAFGDFEFGEGYILKQGQKKAYVKNWGNASEWSGSDVTGVNGFVRPIDYSPTSEGEIMLYAEVESTAYAPLHIVYVTPAWRNRGSNSMVQAAYVRYNFVGTVPSGVSAPAYDTIVKGGTMEPSTAPSATGYTFSGWYTNEAMTTPASSTIYVGSDVNLYGKYTKNSYTVTTSATNGTITPTATVEHGDNKTVSYNCNTGYHLTSVTVDGSAVSIASYPSSYTFSNITSNHSVAVVCEHDPLTVTTTIENGEITPTDNTVPYEADYNVEYHCDTGFSLASVTVNGEAVDKATFTESYLFTQLQDDATVAVVCEAIPVDDDTPTDDEETTEPDPESDSEPEADEEAGVIIPDTGSFTSSQQAENEEIGIMDYVIIGIMVMAGCAGTTLLIRFCLHSHGMKFDRHD